MKTVKNKELLMAADFAGYPLREAIKEYLEKKGWKITDIGVKADSDPNDTELMFHRIGLRVGAMITEKEFDRAMNGAALAVGAGVEITTIPGYMPQYDEKELEQFYCDAVKDIDPELPNHGSFDRCSSTDMGDLSTIMPTLHGYTAGAEGTSHGVSYRIADKTRAYVTNAKILAAIAIDLLSNNAEAAGRIAAKREGKLSVKEYIELADSFNAVFSREVEK